MQVSQNLGHCQIIFNGFCAIFLTAPEFLPGPFLSRQLARAGSKHYRGALTPPLHASRRFFCRGALTPPLHAFPAFLLQGGAHAAPPAPLERPFCFALWAISRLACVARSVTYIVCSLPSALQNVTLPHTAAQKLHASQGGIYSGG